MAPALIKAPHSRFTQMCSPGRRVMRPAWAALSRRVISFEGRSVRLLTRRSCLSSALRGTRTAPGESYLTTACGMTSFCLHTGQRTRLPLRPGSVTTKWPHLHCTVRFGARPSSTSTNCSPGRRYRSQFGQRMVRPSASASITSLPPQRHLSDTAFSGVVVLPMGLSPSADSTARSPVIASRIPAGAGRSRLLRVAQLAVDGAGQCLRPERHRQHGGGGDVVVAAGHRQQRRAGQH